MNPESLDFASLLCSRLCHDLLSPVGALNNGLELLADEDDPAMRAKCMELLADSARASADKLKFFRLAFGAGGGFGDALPAREVRSVAEGLVRGNPRVALGWLADAETFSRSETRLLLNLGLIAFDALVRGGRLDVGLEAGDVVVRAEGARLVLDAEVRGMLDGSATVPSSRSIGAALVRATATAERRTVQLAEEPGLLLLGASRPGGAPAGA